MLTQIYLRTHATLILAMVLFSRVRQKFLLQLKRLVLTSVVELQSNTVFNIMLGSGRNAGPFYLMRRMWDGFFLYLC